MKASIELEVSPFAVPNTVILMTTGATPPATPAQWGIPPAAPPSSGLHVPLNQLEAATLGKMCDQFRRGVFKAAGKEEPDKAEAPRSYPVLETGVLSEFIKQAAGHYVPGPGEIKVFQAENVLNVIERWAAGGKQVLLPRDDVSYLRGLLSEALAAAARGDEMPPSLFDRINEVLNHGD